MLHIRLSAIDHNIRVIRRLVGDRCGICPVLKADAYGLGAARIAPTLAAGGAELFATYTIQQAASIQQAGLNVPILVLMPVRNINRFDGVYRSLVSRRLHLTVHDREHLGDVVRVAERFGATIPVHVEVDTGMSRGGCCVSDVPELLLAINASRRVTLAGLLTQFASSQTDGVMTRSQNVQMNRLLHTCSDLIPTSCVVHAANTCAMIRDPQFHHGMVRIGLAMFGFGPDLITDGEIQDDAFQLRPAVSWTSSIIHIKSIDPGSTVGYGATWKAKRQTAIGIVPVGYADGYPSRLGETSDRTGLPGVGVRLETDQGEAIGYVPVIGAVNMDQIMIDLSDIMDIPGSPGAHVGVGSIVELISDDPSAPNALPLVARAAGRSPHELLCGIHPGVQRMYHQIETKGVGRNAAGVRHERAGSAMTTVASP